MKPSVDTSNASKWTTRSRTSELKEHWHLVIGGAYTCQLQDEVKMCTPAKLDKILCDLQGAVKVAVSINHAISMKADFDIPWSKL